MTDISHLEQKLDELERTVYDSPSADDFHEIELQVELQKLEIKKLQTGITQLNETLLDLAGIISRLSRGKTFVTFNDDMLQEHDVSEDQKEVA